jgi:hypothetical protein
MKRVFVFSLLVLLCASPMAWAQFAGSGTTTLSVTVGPEAAIRIDTASTSLTTSGATFGNPFTGTTNFTYKVRTTQAGGSGSLTLKVTSDFSPAGGPSAASGPLSYTCAVAGVGTACATAQTASTAASTPVVSYGANAKSATAGDTGSVDWTLVNDPAYSTGTYSATVTFTISAA